MVAASAFIDLNYIWKVEFQELFISEINDNINFPVLEFELYKKIKKSGGVLSQGKVKARLYHGVFCVCYVAAFAVQKITVAN